MKDEAKSIRAGEELPREVLSHYLRQNLEGFLAIDVVKQFPGGYSNLTYLLQTNLGDLVLRRPPFGANIKTAHDMGREFSVLNMLEGIYPKIPKPLIYCQDESIIGAPFYLMERVDGLILRNQVPKGLNLSPERMQAISKAAIDNLADLHRLELEQSGLIQLGKPEGYVQRQVEGWIKRYRKAETESVEGMNALADWLPGQIPESQQVSLIHNDYKYDNLVLKPEQPSHIKAVLDWEMCTVGDPLMDLGTTLAYWVEPEEVNPGIVAVSNLTWLPGNLNRSALAEHYAIRSGLDLKTLDFYFAFGSFKIGVILQQIYARWKKGYTKDPRFGFLIELVKVFGERGTASI